MSNKAIDKAYLQRQFKHYDRDIVSQKFGQTWAAIPTPAIDVSSTPTYYSADQYQMYGGKIIQWVGESTPWGSGGSAITLTEGLFYKITMARVSNPDPDVYEYEITDITAVVTGGGSGDTVDYTIGVSSTTSAGALKTYQLYKSVNSGAAEPVVGSIIDIPKDFLVKSASVVTATVKGGFRFKNIWYEYDDTWDYTQHTGDVPALPQGLTTIYKYTNSNLESLYIEANVESLAHTGWPREVFALAGSEWSSQGSVEETAFVVGWMTTEGLTVGDKYIDFIINTKDTAQGSETDEHLYLALDDLVSSYTAGAGVSISSDNVISVNFQYSTLPNPLATGFSADAYPEAIQYVGADDAWGTTNGQETGGTEIASPVKLQLGGFYKYDSTSHKWVLINTAKEDVDITFNINDFS